MNPNNDKIPISEELVVYCNDTMRAAIKFIAELKQLAKDAYPIVRQDAEMIAAMTHHAPFPPEEQAKFDSTKFPSEIWLDKFHELLGDFTDEAETIH